MKNKKRKICVVTGTRAEYGLLYHLINDLNKDKDTELQIIATCMHLSHEFGLTYKQIEADGFFINKKIEILLSSDTPTAISKSMGLAEISFGEAFDELKPDIVVILGDRFEACAIACTAVLHRIPIAHIHGGELSEGAVDDSFRHSISKMSHIHFTATEEYKKRVIQLGEQPNRVYNFGAPGLEHIKRAKLLTKDELEKALKLKFRKRNILITFHPVTLENATAKEQFYQVLSAVDTLHETSLIFTKANADTDGRIINRMIDNYTQKNKNKAYAYDSLGSLKYISVMKYCDIMLGNSSSGIIEFPSFKKPTINIGDRQQGRVRAKSVINCIPKKEEILNAVNKAYSNEFQKQLVAVINPYETGGTASQILKILKNINLDNILKKHFYNIKFTI